MELFILVVFYILLNFLHVIAMGILGAILVAGCILGFLIVKALFKETKKYK